MFSVQTKKVPKCRDVPTEVCEDVETEDCWTEPEQSCWTEPKEKCWEVSHTFMHTGFHHSSHILLQIPDEQCWDEPVEKCWKEPVEDCWEVGPRTCCLSNCLNLDTVIFRWVTRSARTFPRSAARPSTWRWRGGSAGSSSRTVTATSVTRHKEHYIAVIMVLRSLHLYDRVNKYV